MTKNAKELSELISLGYATIRKAIYAIHATESSNMPLRKVVKK